MGPHPRQASYQTSASTHSSIIPHSGANSKGPLTPSAILASHTDPERFIPDQLLVVPVHASAQLTQPPGSVPSHALPRR